MCGSVEEKVSNANMELMGVIESERNAIRKRHVWKLLEEQDRVLSSYYAQREGFDRGGQGTQGQTGLGREYVGHGYICKRQKEKWIGYALCNAPPPSLRMRHQSHQSYAGAGAGGRQPKVETQQGRG